MKLRWYDRILVALSGLVLAAAGVAVVLWGCGAIRLPEPFALDLWTGGDWQWLPVIFLGGACGCWCGRSASDRISRAGISP